MHEPTAVGVAERETGLGCRQLVEVVQPNHVRHLKLCLYGERAELEDTDGVPTSPRKPKPQGQRRDRDTASLQTLPSVPISLLLLHLLHRKRTEKTNEYFHLPGKQLFTSGSRSFSRQARTSLYNLEEEMGARKEVYSPGMLTPSSTEQEGPVSFQREGNGMLALTEGPSNETSQGCPGHGRKTG